MLSPTEILSEDGPLADLITGFTARTQQQELAETIISAMHDGESLICEAGTGTGKTFAYLVPAILSGRKVLISTGTKHLQDQLFRRDLPLVRKALNIPINVALLKGRSNYLCLHRLTLAEHAGADLHKASQGLLVDIRRWSHQSSSGDLAELTDIPEDAGVRSVVTSTAENCLGQECDDYDKCFVFKARRHANEADLTIVNHHLYLADMNLRQQGYGELLPAADIVIFDEAHQLPALASEFFSQTLSARQIQELLRDAKSAYFTEAADLPEFLQMLDNVEKALRDLRLSFARQDLRITWQDIKSQQQVSESLNGLLTTSDTLQQLLKNFAGSGKQLYNCYKRLTNILDTLACFSEP
ncbi:MAG: ATP-dependent DNA helicase, partial [Gammaproteobacteria bacterium]|nr:ATP-dependent DNA helicase [Gammaproteobacteria bacterium]